MDRPHPADPTAPRDLTALPPLEEVLAPLPELLDGWLPRQRWFAHKGAGAPRTALAGWAPLAATAEHLVLQCVAEVTLPDGDRTLYQVPLVLRPARSPHEADEETAVLGRLEGPGAGLQVLDAARDADGRAALWALLGAGHGAVGPSLGLTVHRPDGASAAASGAAVRTRLLSGEQSNSSIVVESAQAPPVILKLFRVLQDGENPDVVLQTALTGAGSTRVPAVVGSAVAELGPLRTHALIAQEFLDDAEDAWRTALRRARAGQDLGEEARELGRALAEVHADLAETFGTLAADPRTVRELISRMRGRVTEIAEELPTLAAHQDRLWALLDAAAELPWPALQRIHGDLHLGQVLRSPRRGWVLVDFEGEPLRPLAERGLPDSPLRDVAGMLRSIDYVAGALRREQGADVTAWAQRARAGFLAGYTEALPAAPDADSLRTVLAALEADKAVYEALYEARNRPDWLPIPLAAIERISAAAGPTAGG